MNNRSIILFNETFGSDLSRIAKLPHDIQAVRSRCHISDKACHYLILLLTEAITNAIVHGNQNDPTRQVKLYVACRGDYVVCYVEDEGEGFSPDKVADPVSPENLLKDGGRGLYIIRTLATKFRIDVLPTGTSLRFSVARGVGAGVDLAELTGVE